MNTWAEICAISGLQLQTNDNIVIIPMLTGTARYNVGKKIVRFPYKNIFSTVIQAKYDDSFCVKDINTDDLYAFNAFVLEQKLPLGIIEILESGHLIKLEQPTSIQRHTKTFELNINWYFALKDVFDEFKIKSLKISLEHTKETHYQIQKNAIDSLKQNILERNTDTEEDKQQNLQIMKAAFMDILQTSDGALHYMDNVDLSEPHLMHFMNNDAAMERLLQEKCLFNILGAGNIELKKRTGVDFDNSSIIATYNTVVHHALQKRMK